MKYYKIRKEDGERTEITYAEARDLIATCYIERVCTYEEMLSEEGIIPCMFSIIEITK